MSLEISFTKIDALNFLTYLITPAIFFFALAWTISIIPYPTKGNVILVYGFFMGFLVMTDIAYNHGYKDGKK